MRITRILFIETRLDANPTGRGPFWAHFVAAALLVYVKYTATVVV